jgi:UDP-GlcNAc:undecaprenyl-phosphate GlcNAc-1-phosphate transferase
MPIIGLLISGVWIVGMTNAINLIDGLDGFASIITMIAFTVIGIVSFGGGATFAVVMSFAMVGGVLGFFLFNRPPAKLFMGDCGSLFLGFSLAVLPLIVGGKWGSAAVLILPITILIIPIVDTANAIFRRVLNGQRIHAPDKSHIHHILLDLGLSNKAILLLVFGFMLVLAVAEYLLWRGGPTVFFVGSVVIWALSFIVYALIFRLHKNGFHHETTDALDTSGDKSVARTDRKTEHQ